VRALSGKRMEKTLLFVQKQERRTDRREIQIKVRQPDIKD